MHSSAKWILLVFLALIPFSGGCQMMTATNASQQPPSNPPPPPPAPGIIVVVSPVNASVQVGKSLQFQATVQNDGSNAGVTWRIDTSSAVNCGAQDYGSIDSTGKYSAPSSEPCTFGVFIVAASKADPTKSDSVGLVVTPAPTGISVWPPNATVTAGATQQFSAVSDPFGSIPEVMWSVTGSGCSAASCGVIDSAGNYMAPAVLPSPAEVKIIATSADDNTLSGSAPVELGANSNNAKLTGQYAFLVNGIDGDGVFQIAGSITADGNGAITSGIVDENLSSSILFAVGVPVTGTYSIGADNRGSITLFGSISSRSSQTFAVALGSFSGGIAGRGKMSEIDGLAFWGGGELAKQDPAAFSSSAISGGFAFHLSGTDSSAGGLIIVGRFTADNGALNQGEFDSLDGDFVPDFGSVPKATQSVFTGTFTASSNGRATATLTIPLNGAGNSNFAFYIVSASEIFIFQTDHCSEAPGAICSYKGGLSGVASKQSSGIFTASSLSGTSILYGDDSESSQSDTGTYLTTFDGAGGVSGIADAVDAGGNVTAVPFGGTYAIDGDGLGRGQLTFAGTQVPASSSTPFYLVAPGQAFILGVGVIQPQTGGPFATASVAGKYVLDEFSNDASLGPSSGVVTADGAGNLTGVTDAHDGEGSGMGATFTGTYNIGANGKGTATTASPSGAPQNWVVYLISPSKILLRQAAIGGARGTLDR